MKYYKQWTLTETLISTWSNCVKVYKDKYILKPDYNCIYFFTKEETPILKAILFVEITLAASQAAFNELLPDGKVRRFRVAGSDMNIAEKIQDALV